MRRLLQDRGRLVLALLFALSLVFQLRVLDEKFLLGDEGIALMGGWRVSQGEVPNLDFFEIIPPLSFLPTAAVFKLFGPGVLQARLLVMAYSLLMLLLVDRLLAGRGVSAWGRTLPLALLTPFGAFYWPVPSHHWVADLFLLGALLALMRAGKEPADGGAPRWACAAGALTALCGLSLQDQGGYFALAILLLVLPWLPSAEGFRRRVGLAWAAGLGGTAGLAALVLVPLVGAGELLHQWVLFPATRYRNIATNVTGAFAGWDMVSGLWASGSWSARPLYALSLTACVVGLFALPAAALFALGSLWRKLPQERRATQILAAGALACAAAAAHRWSLTNLVWAAPALIPPVAWALDRAAQSPRPRLRLLGRLALGAGTAAAVLFGLSYYAGGRVVRMAMVQGPAGSLRTSRVEEAWRVQQTLEAIQGLMPPDAPLFCNGYTPLINFLALRPNPTRYQFFFHPGYHTETQAAEVIDSLRAHPDAWVLLPLPVNSRSVLEAFVIAQYAVAWQNDRCVLLAPKPPSPAPPQEPERAEGAATAR